MATLTEKETLGLIDKAEYLGKTIRTHSGLVTPDLTGIYGVKPAQGDGEPTPRVDWDELQDANAEVLEDATQQAREKGQTHRQNKVRVSQLIIERNGAVGELKEHHNSLHLSIEATYGLDKLELVGLDAAPVKKYLGLREQCREISDRMRTPGLREAFGNPRVNHSHLPFDKLADGLDSVVQRFEDVYNELVAARKVVQLSMVAKNEANDFLNRVYTNVARMQEGMFRLAGMDELADRIRITVPARPRKDDDKETGEGDPPQDDPPHDNAV